MTRWTIPLTLLAALLAMPAASALAVSSSDLPLPGYGPVPLATGAGLHSAASADMAVFMDLAPWGRTSIPDALTNLGLTADYYSSSDMGVIDLTPYPKVVIPSDQPQAFYDAFHTHHAWLESYVASGGVVELHAATLGWHAGKWPAAEIIGGIIYTPFEGDNVVIVLPGDMLMTTPHAITQASLQGWWWSYHGRLALPPGSTTVVSDPSGNPLLGYVPYGSGYIVVSSQTLEWGYADYNSDLLENVLAMGVSTAPVPLPEMPTLLLAGVGLVAIALVVGQRRRA